MAELDIATIAIVILAVLVAAIAITFLIGIYSEGTNNAASPVSQSEQLMKDAKGQLERADNTVLVVEQMQDYKDF